MVLISERYGNYAYDPATDRVEKPSLGYLIYHKKYETIEEVKADMFQYIELFYNRNRLHSSLGYMSPVEYRLQKCA